MNVNPLTILSHLHTGSHQRSVICSAALCCRAQISGDVPINTGAEAGSTYGKHLRCLSNLKENSPQFQHAVMLLVLPLACQ